MNYLIIFDPNTQSYSSKCVLNIVPKDNRLSTFKIDPKCELRRSCKIKKKPTKKTSKKTKK